MKLLLIAPIALICTSCSLLEDRKTAPVSLPSITQKIESCVKSRINEGVKPLEALKICDTIFRGRE